MKSLGIITLSGDPITKGHLWMVKESLNLFTDVELVIGNNTDKKYLFDMTERIRLAEKSVEEHCVYHHRQHITVTGRPSDDYVALIAQERYEDGYEKVAFVRGLRNSMDMEYEHQLDTINRQINAFLSTVYLIPPVAIQHISSSAVKAQYKLRSWHKVASQYVTASVEEALRGAH